MNDYIGKEGLEKYLEKNLRGKNGRMVAEQDENGHYVALTEAVPAESGNSVYLTIDLDVQKAAEKALKETVAEIYSKHEERGYGADVAGGAAVAIDVETGEVICMASYPDYSIEDYNKNYSKLISDRNNPLFNRALSGTYSPGSTYKMLVGIAALEEKVILPDTLIKDEVIYKLGQGHFKCLHDHGFVNVSTAIKDSCNYFFYTAGYQLGIDKMVEYADKFGLGKSTGIELPEETGTVSSPETKALRDEPWYEGYTLQAAIGQDDNKFTPIQLASYVSQIASGGVRYTPHLVKGIYSYGGKEVISLTEIKESDRITLTQENLDAVRYGMRLVALSGTASLYFEDYPIKVAAKTGTAEVYGGSDNGLFVAYGLNWKLSNLISAGTGICGGSAVAALAPVIDAEDKDVAFALSSTFLFDMVMVALYPIMGRALGMSDIAYGIWAGTSVNDTASVVASGYAFSEIAGDFATMVKLTRTLTIIPTVVVFALINLRLKQREAAAAGDGKLNVNVGKLFPWFILGFLGMALVASILPIPAEVVSATKRLSKFLMVCALAAIGLNTSFASLKKSGPRPMLHGFIISALVVIVALLVEMAMGIV